ncbi:HEAT repeat domain-containing protein [Clostridium sp. D53t1_180928_C8]|uniref:HEAT repeat domain-containing protein n=1 Tax=Clostridium sp. D53t1_180928_C8 TaxID=2787101 RepID=UPI0018A94A63|nr:HEAT repeat domain-containing protein [Clostridium sp. D53t1_180928_C8]
MQNVAKIYIILSFFIYIILSAIVYMIIIDKIDIIYNKKVKKLDTTFKKVVLQQLNCIKEDKGISKIDIQYVLNKLKKKHYINSFINAITEFNKDRENHNFTRIYSSNFEDFIEAFLKKNKKKDETIKAFCAVVLGEFKLSNYEVNTFLIECLNTNSIYLRVASLEAISKIGNEKNFIQAIKYISDKNYYIHNKVFIDILNQFEGNTYLLNKELLNNFNVFNNNLKKNIIEHYKNNKVEFVKENLIDILKGKNAEKEIRISIIKYFSSVIHKYAQDVIIEILRRGDWEYRAVCATALASYKNEDSVNALLVSVTDKNWYVRYNSAISLLQFGDDVIDLVFLKEDKYSRDIIFYAMFMKNKISYEEYLEKSRDLEGIYNV